MEKIIEQWKLIIFVFASISTTTITLWSGYQSILESIENNKKSIEMTQIMLLKTQVRTMERNPCYVSDSEWDEYIEKYTILFELLKSNGKISKDTPWSPIERVKEGTEC